MVAVPSSTPPSTPGSSRRQPAGDHPSTTPAGPPPSHRTNASFTPAGPPPSSAFGSSVLHSYHPPSSPSNARSPSQIFPKQAALSPSRGNVFASISQNPFAGLAAPAKSQAAANKSRPLDSSPPLPQASDDEDDAADIARDDESGMDLFADDQDESMLQDKDDLEIGDVEMGDPEQQHSEASNDADPQFDWTAGDIANEWAKSRIGKLSNSQRPPEPDAFLSSTRNGSLPQPFQFSAMAQGRSQTATFPDLPDMFNSYGDDEIGAIAKAYAAGVKPAGIEDNDEVVIGIEDCLDILRQASLEGDTLERNERIYQAINELGAFWERHSAPFDVNDSGGIGPPADADIVTRVSFVAGLMIQLQQPSSKPQPNTISSFAHSRPPPPIPSVPRLLLDWLQSNHDTSAPALASLREYAQTGFSAHSSFWQILPSLLIRGNLGDAIQLLRGANFEVAHSAVDDGAENGSGYRGQRLVNVNKVVRRAIQVLESCPAAPTGRDDDDAWDIWSPEWSAFRQRAQAALEELRAFAEGDSRTTQDDNYNGEDEFPTNRSLRVSNFAKSSGLRDSRNDLSFSRASRRAESRVPWTVYEGLRFMYKQLTGDEESIIAASADWVEASIALTIWWEGGATALAAAGPDRPLLLPNYARQGRGREAVIDTSPTAVVYRRRLVDAFYLATSHPDSQLRPDGTNGVEIALACVLAGEVEGLVRVVRGWSATSAMALVEAANTAGWVRGRSSDMVDGLDDQDLLVLAYDASNQQNGKVKDVLDLDSSLTGYAELLETRQQFTFEGREVEGWEAAVRTLARLPDPAKAGQKVAELAARIQLDTSTRTDKLLEICAHYGLQEQGRQVSERFADFLVKQTGSERFPFGQALLYYARAHNAAKAHDLVTLLLTSSLIHSTPFPKADKLDDLLAFQLEHPQDYLSILERYDAPAAKILAKALSGYAALRKFYNHRDKRRDPDTAASQMDADAQSQHSKSGGSGNLQTRRAVISTNAAAGPATLTSLISASADRIRGGLYDGHAPPSAIPVDALLPLLGEALVYLAPRRSAPPPTTTRSDTTTTTTTNNDSTPSSQLPTARFTFPQLMTILSAVEDFDTVPAASIRDSSARLLASTLAAVGSPSKASDNDSGSPSGAPKTNNASLSSSSSSFELLAASGSLSLSSAPEHSGFVTVGASGILLTSESLTAGAAGTAKDNGSSKKKKKKGGDGDGEVEVERAWDWRKGLKPGAGREDVVRLVRMGIADAVAGYWAGGEL